MKNRLVGYISLILVAILGGCATPLIGASQVGGKDSATWVFIQSTDKDDTGVYRCVETNDGPVCRQAAIKH